MVADELRRQADDFVDLTSLMPRIGRDPAERGVRSADPRRAAHYAANTQPVEDVARD